MSVRLISCAASSTSDYDHFAVGMFKLMECHALLLVGRASIEQFSQFFHFQLYKNEQG